MSSVKLGLIQMSCSDEPALNLEKACRLVSQAAKQGAKIVALSELFESLYFCQTEDTRFFDLAKPIPGTTTERLSRLAKEEGIVIIASLYEKTSSALYNTAVVFDADGTLLGKYRKTHIPNDLEHSYGETFYFAPGDLGYPVFQTRFGKVGVLVCWDQWYPEAARQMALQGVEILFYPTAIGYQVHGDRSVNEAEHEAWQTIQRSHAIANNIFVAAINRIGIENNLDFWGTSFVADPLGRVLAKGTTNKEEIVFATCNLEEIKAARHDWPFLKCRRTDIYS